MAQPGSFFRATFGLLLATLAGSMALSAAEPSALSPPPSSGEPASPVVVPFEFRRGHVMVSTKVNLTNTLSLLLDTGYGMTMLHPDHVDAFGLKRTGRITIVGIAGEEPAGVYEGPSFDFAGTTWKPRRIAALSAEAQPRSRRRDGILGSGFFRRFVVEIDSARKTLSLHEPKSFRHLGRGEVLPLSFKSSTPIVEVTVQFPNGTNIQAAFEIDTGCDGALCIGKHFVEAHHLVPTNSVATSGGRVGVGGSTRTRNGHLPRLTLGKTVIEKPEASFFLESSPADAPRAGHIGWDLLRKFKVTFDYSRNQLILEPLQPSQ